MKYKFEDFYGTGRLVPEVGEEKIYVGEKGIMVQYQGLQGKLYTIRDRSFHVGGQGSCNDYSCQGVVVTKDLELLNVNQKWDRGFDIEIMENLE